MPRVLTAFKFCSLKPVIRNRTLSQIAMNGDVSRHSCWPINLKKSSDGKTSYAPNRGATFCLVKLSIRFLITFKIWENIVRKYQIDVFNLLTWIAVGTNSPIRTTGDTALFIYPTGARACISLIFSLYSGIIFRFCHCINGSNISIHKLCFWLFIDFTWTFGAHDEEAGRSLAVPYVMQLRLICCEQHIVNHWRNIHYLF